MTPYPIHIAKQLTTG